MSNKRKAITPVFPEEQSSILPDTRVTIASILEGYNARGQQFADKGIDYNAITLLTTISNLYLIKKYGTNCFLYGDKGKDPDFLYGGFVFKFSQGQLDEAIERILPDMSAQIDGKNLFQIKTFLNCIKTNGNPVIIIPLLLEFADGTHHANMLIYRQATNRIEHFEPHGPFFDLRPDYGDKITRILQLLIDKINQVNEKSMFRVLSGDIMLMSSKEVCVDEEGLQAIQQELRGFSIEGPGYCQMWSLLFAEMALLNPTINSKDILGIIYKLLESEDGAVFLSNVIRGYVSVLGDEISLYLSEYINNVFTIENISYTCRVFPDYGRYLSDILSFIVTTEINVDLVFSQLNYDMCSLSRNDARYQVILSTYFTLQSEVKELLIIRKRNYSPKKQSEIEVEIRAKLNEELHEYSDRRKRDDIKNYVQNKIFINYLKNKQQIVVADKKSKVVRGRKAASASADQPDDDEVKKRDRTKIVSGVEVEVVENKPRKSRKGGKKYKTKKIKKSRKSRKSRKSKKK